MLSLNTQEEIWKDIPDYIGYYQASNLGRIKGLERFVNAKFGSKRKVSERIVGLSVGQNGYKYCTLANMGNNETVRVHQIVAKVFIPNLKNKKQINHIDHNKTNNKVDNLEWVTPSENRIHFLKDQTVLHKCDDCGRAYYIKKDEKKENVLIALDVLIAIKLLKKKIYVKFINRDRR